MQNGTKGQSPMTLLRTVSPVRSSVRVHVKERFHSSARKFRQRQQN
jgi:hypothetical protein